MARLEVPRPATFVSLTGFMGVGKSRIGKELARALMLHFIDLDRYIERRTGISIPDIFRHLGEEAFRKMEKEAVRELLGKDFLVLSLGGGTFVDPENRKALLGRGPVVALWASPETILERTLRKPGERPLLQVENPLERIRTLLEARRPVYQEAHIHVSTDGRKVEEVVAEIVEKLWAYAKARRP
ncbi:shikimate kinase [Thermus arciformis]|uniref:Shikimate kinase n=1 Tax=Thermus arciformis TaxID=482827 RepID=A0A1G7CUV9_9DEIN|nr:shikimate kinase [Thermus arciformis]SDE43132.1 shikimate kinase [Thermus arciformis]